MPIAAEVEKTQRGHKAALYTCPGGQCQGQLNVAGWGGQSTTCLRAVPAPPRGRQVRTGRRKTFNVSKRELLELL